MFHFILARIDKDLAPRQTLARFEDAALQYIHQHQTRQACQEVFDFLAQRMNWCQWFTQCVLQDCSVIAYHSPCDQKRIGRKIVKLMEDYIR